MIKKGETSACVTNNISLEHIYENLQDYAQLIKRHKHQWVLLLAQKKKGKKQRYGNSSS
jgi:hypothetical protein